MLLGTGLEDAMPTPGLTLDLEREFDSSAMTSTPAGVGSSDVRPEDAEVLLWTERYALGARRLLPDLERGSGAAEAVHLIACSSFFAAGKVYRALVGRVDQPWCDPLDARDSAAMAVLALDRSHDAWRALLGAGLVDASAVGGLLQDLQRIRSALAAAFPQVAIERARRAAVAEGAGRADAGGRTNKRPEV